MTSQPWPVDTFRREALFADRVVHARAARPQSFHALMYDAAERSPEGDALVCGSFRISWGALKDLAEECAGGLAARGVGKGDRVAFLIPNRVEFVVALFAVSLLGAITVPISTREQAPGIAHAISHAGARLLLYDPSFRDRLPEGNVIPTLEEAIATGDPEDPLRALRTAGGTTACPVAETDIAAILYTSGTTGKPKGAMIAHTNIVHSAMLYEQVMQLATGERSVVAVPMTHVTGLTALIAAMARCAGALIIMPEFKADAFVALAAAERMTHTVLVPAMYNLILNRVDLAEHDLSQWRIGGYGGAPMPAPTIQRLHGVLPQLGLMNLYGATETSCAQLVMPPDQAFARREQVGRPAPGAEVAIMDEQGVECEAGQPGEIWLRSATVVSGYWNDPAASRAALIGGFWRSGDIGVADAAGYVAVLDRTKDMIIRGGFKVYSAEVESTLAEHPEILESAVVGRPCPILGERVHAFIATGGATIDETELAKFCAPRLADYKRPETYTISSIPLPRNANGKVLKLALRETLLEDSSGTSQP